MQLRQSKIILYVTGDAAVVSVWRGQHYQAHQVCQNEAKGHEVFRQCLLQHKTAVVSIVVDVIEEEYQLALLPHVTGGVKHEMLSRKLSQFCQHSAYKAALFLRQEKAARQEDHYVLLALSNADSLKHWLKILHDEDALLSGITTLPMVTQLMVWRFKPISPQLLVCERLSSGLRISYLQHGHLRMSRLTPVGRVQPMQLADFYLMEIEKMQLYLQSQKIVSAEDVLEIRLSALEAAHDDVAIGLAQRGLECRVNHKHHDIGKQCLPQADVEVHPELLHMQWLAKGNKLDNIAPFEITRNYLVKRFAERLAIGMVVLTAFGLLVSIGLLYDAHEKRAQCQLFLEQISVLTEQKALIATPTVPSKARKSAVVLAEAINHMPASPLLMMNTVSTALASEPRIVINRLYYAISEHLHIKGEEEAGPSKNENESHQDGWLEIAYLNAEVKPFSGNYVAALATVNRFIQKLRTAQNVMSVSVLKMPVNIDSSKRLQGSTRAGAFAPEFARFKLKVILEPTKRGAKE